MSIEVYFLHVSAVIVGIFIMGVFMRFCEWLIL